MTKVYPNAAAAAQIAAACGGAPAILTVWRKSLLFNCSGFTVFDAAGDLAFRVDNYSSAPRGEVVLMDAAGQPLLTLRRKKLSLGEQWLVYDGEDAVKSRFAVKKHVSITRSKSVAHVRGGGGSYEVEGSYGRRCCEVVGGGEGRRRVVAEVQRKEAAAKGVGFGADVFRLVVQPGFDAADAMAIVVGLDQMFGSR